ncbi:hypothetical protein [Alteribacillus sp. YIM 98480]|uniref:hypothetical protein n=1 Tax=Alteribacillus sp. YIM 98480 TaxID=2606599 RepID=UPI00131D0863|nr:hypothetical protein [Alteribacillus sp. YIM 98480]
MGLDQQTKYVLYQLEKPGAPNLHSLSTERARDAFVKMFTRQEETVPVGNVEIYPLKGQLVTLPYEYTILKLSVKLIPLS